MTNTNSAITSAAVAAFALSLPTMASAQSVPVGGGQVSLPVAAAAASDSAMRQIRTESVGSGYTVEAIKNGIINQNRAFGASTGFFPVATANSSLSSGPVSSGLVGGSKPFSGLQPSSTVSPYLNLFNQGPTGRSQTLDNYNLLVRPMLDQQRTNSQMQRQQQQMNMKVQAISARPDFEAAGSQNIIPTGHQTGFGYYSHFYPGKNINRRQK
ncbi:hypothetical protein [Botrimarina mediterranea]|uniref:Uncharacterized protein n=1 Tax=Botrimarina mediterranea TaxID=2528022 RepID=A0A518K3E6_9BACT|nr:hypothetical protein [Botrimarina mediterranea]QDV72328.1 hypothetical protein Spa11_05020 [Botrimarina mediterranea]